jgi:hypothetical protein
MAERIYPHRGNSKPGTYRLQTESQLISLQKKFQ